MTQINQVLETVRRLERERGRPVSRYEVERELPDVPSARSLLAHLCERGEVMADGEGPYGRGGRSCKLYRTVARPPQSASLALVDADGDTSSMSALFERLRDQHTAIAATYAELARLATAS
jgi:hypothetical protein